MKKQNTCHHCEGKGYTELRDCSGDIQRTERCSFCEGLGYVEVKEESKNKAKSNKECIR
jgi:DnaJ-class molecular chaperone